VNKDNDSAGTSNDDNAEGCNMEVMTQPASTVASCTRALSRSSGHVLLGFCRLS